MRMNEYRRFAQTLINIAESFVIGIVSEPICCCYLHHVSSYSQSGKPQWANHPPNLLSLVLSGCFAHCVSSRLNDLSQHPWRLVMITRRHIKWRMCCAVYRLLVIAWLFELELHCLYSILMEEWLNVWLDGSGHLIVLKLKACLSLLYVSSLEAWTSEIFYSHNRLLSFNFWLFWLRHGLSFGLRASD